MNAHPNPTVELTTFDALRLPQMSPDLRQAVAEHLSCVLVDEAQFDEAGNAFDEAEAERTLEAEFSRFRIFCETPCRTPSDIQAKLAYVLDCTQGERTPLYEYLYAFDGNELQLKFLQSLQLEGAN